MYTQVKKFLGFDKPLMGRKQFLLNYFIVFFVSVIGRFFLNRMVAIGNAGDNVTAIVFLILSLGTIILLFYVYVPSLIRRSTDAGLKKVWWLGLIPLFNFLFAVLLIFKGSSQPKR